MDATILRADLSKEKFSDETIEEEVLRHYVGGICLGAWMLYREVRSGYEASDPQNRLIFATSPLVGTAVPASCQYVVVSKSPLSGFIGVSHSKGFLGPEMRFSGYDGIIIQGSAKHPLYLWIDDGEVELRDASNLWGKLTNETEDSIRQELHDPKIKVASIGPAGETLSGLACIVNDRDHIAARGGLGAVMGSKKLKAIAVRGSKRVPVANISMLREIARKWRKLSLDHPTTKGLSRYGTAGNYERTERRVLTGDLPVKNWTTSLFPEWRKISGEHLQEKYDVQKNPCFACHVGHDYLIRLPKGSPSALTYPEYEDTAAFGSNLGISSPEDIVELTNLANKYGLDAIECSAVIALAMECYEKGLITEKDTGDIELRWGNADAVRDIMQEMVESKGIGKMLARGVKRAADLLGASDLAVQTHGMAILMHDIRHNWGFLISFIMAGSGPTHEGYAVGGDPDIGLPDRLTPFSVIGRGEAAKRAQMKKLFLDSLGICWWGTFGVPVDIWVQAVGSVTGWDFTREDGFAVGLRAANLMRSFNIKHGFKPEDDWPSRRVLESPVDGPVEGISPGKVIKGLIGDYYHHMGWDPKTGKPWRTTLVNLGLTEVAEDLWT